MKSVHRATNGAPAQSADGLRLLQTLSWKQKVKKCARAPGEIALIRPQPMRFGDEYVRVQRLYGDCARDVLPACHRLLGVRLPSSTCRAVAACAVANDVSCAFGTKANTNQTMAATAIAVAATAIRSAAD